MKVSRSADNDKCDRPFLAFRSRAYIIKHSNMPNQPIVFFQVIASQRNVNFRAKYSKEVIFALQKYSVCKKDLTEMTFAHLSSWSSMTAKRKLRPGWGSQCIILSKKNELCPLSSSFKNLKGVRRGVATN